MGLGRESGMSKTSFPMDTRKGVIPHAPKGCNACGGAVIWSRQSQLWRCLECGLQMDDVVIWQRYPYPRDKVMVGRGVLFIALENPAC